MFIFFIALRNILWLYSSAKGTVSFTSLEPVNTFVLLTVTFPCQQRLRERATKNVTRTLITYYVLLISSQE
jgi:hypothetical protein